MKSIPQPVRSPYKDRLEDTRVPGFEELMKEIDGFRVHKYRQFTETTIDLSTALTNHRVPIEGRVLHIEYPVSAKIRINDDNAPLIDLLKVRHIFGAVHTIFVTSDAQDPNLVIKASIGGGIDWIENAPLVGKEITGSTSGTSYVTALTWYSLPFAGKKIQVDNTGGANGMYATIIGYTGNDATGVVVDAAQSIGAAQYHEFTVPESYERILIRVKAAGAGADTTYRINYIGTVVANNENLKDVSDATETDDTAWSTTPKKVMMMGATMDDTTPDNIDEGDAGALRCSNNRSLHVMLMDENGEVGAQVNASKELITHDDDLLTKQTAIELALGDVDINLEAIELAAEAVETLQGIDGGGDLQKVKEELEKLVTFDGIDGAGDLQKVKEALETIDADTGKIAGSGACYAKAVTVTSTSVAVEASAKMCNDIVIQNDHATVSTLIGNTSVRPVTLAPGDTVSFRLIDLNTVYVIRVGGANGSLAIIGSEQ